MTEKTNKPGFIEKAVQKNRKSIALALGLAAIYGIGEVGQGIASSHKAGGPDKTYLAKPYDTEWTIAEKAFPNSDPRPEVSKLDTQLPHDAVHANHTVQPGDRFTLPGNADIGTSNKAGK
jgi:hypothetical protein